MLCNVDDSVIKFFLGIERSRLLDQRTYTQWVRMSNEEKDYVKKWILDNWISIGFPDSLKKKGFRSLYFSDQLNRAAFFLIRFVLKNK